MIRRAAPVLLVALAIAGGCRSRPAPAAKAVGGLPAVAFERLTETEISRFVGAAAAVTEHLAWNRPPADERPVKFHDDIGTVYSTGIDRVGRAPGIDSVLAARGTDWPSFRATLLKLSACVTAVGADEAAAAAQETERRLASEAEAKAYRRRLSQVRQIAGAVPAGNVETFKRHFRELRVFFNIIGY